MTMFHSSHGIATPIAGIQELCIEGDGCGGVKLSARRNEIEIVFGLDLTDVAHVIDLLQRAAAAFLDGSGSSPSSPEIPR